jgi:glycosyltransferase involved in cell wall biosynthesis
MKKIEWLCSIPNCRLQDLERSTMASIRMRTAVSAKAACKAGYQPIFSDGHVRTKAGLIVVGKIDYISDPARPGRWIAHLEKAKRSGAKVIIDYTDHHLATDSPASQFYLQALTLANTIVCSSAALAGHLSGRFRAHLVTIEDPVEIDIRPPGSRSSDIPTALWFGHASNLPYLVDYLIKDFDLIRPMRLILMTNSYPLHSEFSDQLNSPKLDPLDIQVVPWSLESMSTAAALSDFCLLPAGVNDPRKSGASSNRLLTALALGLPVAADPMASYLPFQRYFTNLRDSGLNDLLDNPARYFEMVMKAQDHIKAKFSPEVIGMHWQSLIETELKTYKNPIVARSIDATRSDASRQPKLQVLIITYNQANLCGRIIANIESYVSENIGVLIQDDCSSDGTYELLAEHFKNHSYVTVIRNQENLGASRNSASIISKATGEYSLNLGGDDFVIPEEINRALQLLKDEAIDVGIFKCAHSDVATIDYILFGQKQATEKITVYVKNDQYANEKNINHSEFYRSIATTPGALWGQGIIFRTDLLKSIQFMDSENVDEWGLFHNLAVHSQSNYLKTKSFQPVISLLAVLQNSRGSNVQAQLTRQLSAVANNWHESYRKSALINVLEKKLRQFRNSDLDANEIIFALKNSFSKI